MPYKTFLISSAAVAVGLLVGLWAYQKLVVRTAPVAAQAAAAAPVQTPQLSIAQQVAALLAADNAL